MSAVLLMGAARVLAQDLPPDVTPAPPAAFASAAEAAASSPPSPTSAQEPLPTASPESVADQTRALWQLELDAPEAIQATLATYLDVARFRTVSPGDEITQSELARLVAGTPLQVRELLHPLGYFQPEIEITVEASSKPGESIVRLRVRPGPQARVGRSTLELQGELQEKADAGDVEALSGLAALRSAWPLVAGLPFTQAQWATAKSTLLARLRTQGYAAASFAGTAAQVDAGSGAVRIFVVADSGPRFHFGAIVVDGLERYEATSVTRLAPFVTGEAYSERSLLDFQERLQKVNLFENVQVMIDPDVTQAQAVPVRVTLREVQSRQSLVGVGWSSDAGARLTLEHVDRRIFGYNWQATTKAQLGEKARSLSVDLLSHPKTGFNRNLAAVSTSIDSTGAKEVRSRSARLGRTQDTSRIERYYYAEYLRDTTAEADGPKGSSALSVNYAWTWRDLDNVVLPTRGSTASAKLTLGRSYKSVGGAGRAGSFSRASTRLTGYWPLGSWYTQGRLELGQVFGSQQVAVPYSLEFRAGGDESVRGYRNESIGPEVDGKVVGGRVLGTVSAEIARPFSPRLPQWWWAGFVDAGDAAPTWAEHRLKLGVGVGLRWRSPVGPLRLDLARGLQSHQTRVHFMVGITF